MPTLSEWLHTAEPYAHRQLLNWKPHFKTEAQEVCFLELNRRRPGWAWVIYNCHKTPAELTDLSARCN